MEILDAIELQKFKIKTYYEEINKCNAKIRTLEIELYGEQENTKLITAQDIIQEVSKKYGVGDFEITGRCRKKEIMPARREACRRLFSIGYTQKRIGEIMGNRKHSSILYLLKERKKNVK